MRWSLVPRNVSELVSPPRRASYEFRVLSSEQARTFLQAVKGDRLEALYVLAITTGMRELVFPNSVGRPINVSNFLPRDFYPLLKPAGLPRMRFHDLRHSAATLLLELRIHPKVVSEMLGHSQIGITLDLYSHVTATMQQQAVAALDGLFGDQLGLQHGGQDGGQVEIE